MDSEDKIELIQIAIQQLMEEEKTDYKRGLSDDEDEDQRLLLSRLLAQIETFKGGKELQQLEPSSGPTEVAFPAVGKLETEIEIEIETETETGAAQEVDDDISSTEVGRDEIIVRELGHVKRQNFITHCLLSALIILTLAWQYSEMSLILKFKNGFNRPFSVFGNMLTGFLKLPGKIGQKVKKQSSSPQQQTEVPSLPLTIPELSNINLDGDDEGW